MDNYKFSAEALKYNNSLLKITILLSPTTCCIGRIEHYKYTIDLKKYNCEFFRSGKVTLYHYLLLYLMNAYQ